MPRRTIWLAIALTVMIGFHAGSAYSLGFEGIGGKLAFVSPDGLDSTILVGVVADVGSIIPMLGGEASIDYWSNSEEISGITSSFSSLNVNGTAKYHFPVPGSISPFAGGGLSLNFSTAKVDAPPLFGIDTSTSDTDMDLAFHLVGGISMPLTPLLKFSAEAKAGFGGVDTFQIGASIVMTLK